MKHFRSVVLSLLFFVTHAQPSTDPPKVQTDKTLFIGSKLLSDSQREISAFQGIPYAKPPIGDLRFKPPVPISHWPKRFMATDDGNVCIQKNLFLKTMFGHEDCLYMNIYKPTFPRTAGKLPVLIFIPGGAFKLLSGNLAFFGPQKFLDHDIIFVSFNYRLGVLGFLSTGDSSSPGNYGLLDQVLAMKWVKDNIIYFGGDPEKITISGESAGAISVTSHLISPLTKGLFHAAIAESGTIFMPSTLIFEPINLAKRLAQEVGCPENSTWTMVECFREQPAYRLVELGNSMKVEYLFQFTPRFVPVVDGYFLPTQPEELFKKGLFHRVPILTGINKDEGLFFYRITLQDDANNTYSEHLFDQLKGRLAKFMIQMPFNKNGENIMKVVYEKFLKNVNFNNSLEGSSALTSLITMAMFAAPVVKFVDYTSPVVPTYLYQFEHRGEMWIGYLKKIFDDNTSVTHGDDLIYLFNGFWSLFKQSQRDKHISKLFVGLFANFCQYHDPTPSGSVLKWTPYVTSKMNFLRIKTTPIMSDGFYKDQVPVFNDLLPKILETGESTIPNRVHQELDRAFIYLNVYAGFVAVIVLFLVLFLITKI